MAPWRLIAIHTAATAADLVVIFWSARVHRDVRLIVLRTDGSLLLCYVGHHDDAYGVPAEWLAEVRAATRGTFLELADHLSGHRIAARGSGHRTDARITAS